jgi:hypothetical protein
MQKPVTTLCYFTSEKSLQWLLRAIFIRTNRIKHLEKLVWGPWFVCRYWKIQHFLTSFTPKMLKREF